MQQEKKEIVVKVCVQVINILNGLYIRGESSEALSDCKSLLSQLAQEVQKDEEKGHA